MITINDSDDVTCFFVLILILLLQPDPQVHGRVQFVNGEEDLRGLGDLRLEVEDAFDFDAKEQVELANDWAENWKKVFSAFVFISLTKLSYQNIAS